jgi:lysophospholipase L1-like esterase
VPAKLYIALGDSVSAGYGAPPGRGFVELYDAYLRDPAHGGLEQLANLSVPGETSTSMRSAGGQLDRALAKIGEGSDTAVVTLDIGGNDARLGQCPSGFNAPPCPFRDNYTAIVEALAGALAGDPGDETLQVLEYYNPASGTGSADEARYDYFARGSDGRVDCSGTGNEVGGADITFCVGRAHGATAVDAYPTFKAVGQKLIADGIHPNELGHAYLACLFEHPERAGSLNPCDPNGIPDTVAPRITLHASRRQRVLRRHGLRVVVATGEDAKVTVRGTIALPHGPRVIRFRRLVRPLAANTPAAMRLRLTTRGRAKLRRALRGRRALRARIVVVATDAAGNARRETRRIRVVR